MPRVCALLLLLFLALPTAVQAADLNGIIQLYKKGQREEALRQLDAFLASLPKGAWGRNVTQARMLKGVILAELRRHNEAIQVFTQLTLEYPQLPEPYNNLAVLYAAQGHYETAREILEQGLRTDPVYAALQANLGDIYSQLSEQAYTQTLQSGSDKSAPLRIQALCETYGALAKQAAGRDMPAHSVGELTLLREIQPGRVAASGPPAHVEIDEMAVMDTQTLQNQPAAPSRVLTPSITPAHPVQHPDAQEQARVVSTVHAWARAWSSKNVEAYLGFYGSAFRPPNALSRKAWASQRRERISRPQRIHVGVEDVRVTFTDTRHARVAFRQHYRSDTLRSDGRKTLFMQKEREGWKIMEERVGD